MSNEYLERDVLQVEAIDLEHRIAETEDPSWKRELQRDLARVQRQLAGIVPERRGRHVR
jgi:hypothetical protein